jgi:hypothetical protein
MRYRKFELLKNYQIGMGAVLQQKFEDGRHPVMFISKKFSGAECNYAVIEKECFAIVWAVKMLRVNQGFLIQSLYKFHLLTYQMTLDEYLIIALCLEQFGFTWKVKSLL